MSVRGAIDTARFIGNGAVAAGRFVYNNQHKIALGAIGLGYLVSAPYLMLAGATYETTKLMIQCCCVRQSQLKGMTPNELIKVYDDTMQVAKTGDKKTIEEMQKNTMVIQNGGWFNPGKHLDRLAKFAAAQVKQVTNPFVEVKNRDCLYAAEDLIRPGYKRVVVLNMASDHTPGGGVKDGSRAQEEELCRRSNYMLSIDLHENRFLNRDMGGKYNIPEAGLIYTRGVTISRSGSDKNYRWLSRPLNVDMIASAAYDLNRGAISDYENKTKEKIRWQLRAALKAGNDALVLSAFGCGAYGNKPQTVSRLYNEVFQEPEFKGITSKMKIVFAIIDDHNTRQGISNFGAFAQTLNNKAY